MPLKSVAGKTALNIAVSVSLLIVGLGGGAALGILKGPASASAAVPGAASVTGFTEADSFEAAGLTVEEAPPTPEVRKTKVRRVVTQAAPRAASSQPGSGAQLTVSVPGASAGGSNASCGARLDDRKINWLLNLVAKAKDANPDQAAVADRVAGQLRSAMGQNMCPEEAQVHISNMCADAGTKKFMALMVKELPFFVRPMVGDPCKHDLVEAANKWLPSS
ncbi:MAG TPA: hypothetical protein VHI31_07970 [Actinomycetota bacterium]|nr:hypothetical protein [Actinomycetota bacterium]